MENPTLPDIVSTCCHSIMDKRRWKKIETIEKLYGLRSVVSKTEKNDTDYKNLAGLENDQLDSLITSLLTAIIILYENRN